MIIKDNLWDIYHEYDTICCTCNEIIKNNGELVMGAGIAKQFAQKFKWLSKYWGDRIKQFEKRQGFKPNIIVTDVIEENDDFYYPFLVYFKTKFHWKDPSELFLIGNSMVILCKCIDLLGWQRVLLPAPGCSNGGLDWKRDVYPILKPYLDKYPEIDIIMKE